MARILVIDDDEDFLHLVRRILTGAGHEVFTAASGEEGLKGAGEMLLDLVLLDLKLPGIDGLELLQAIKAAALELEVLVVTGFGSIETAVEAMRRGAYDYLTKPFEPDELLIRVERALERVRLLNERRALKREQAEGEVLQGLIGQHPAMVRIRTLIRQVAPTSAPVLITGETGTGKELVARALHALSPRRERRFVAVNCTALPETLLESELFGHVKGAFTGAIRDKRGLVEEADGGTLFLDEIGDVSPVFQGKLLRVLQEGEFQAVGETRVRRADLRIIAATNQQLQDKIERGTFRADLFFRLCVIPIHLPPLRERKDDIPLLVDHFLKKHAQRLGKEVPELSAEALNQLLHYEWPGNVRELEHVIERTLILSRGRTLTPEDLFPPALSPVRGSSLNPSPPGTLHLPYREARRRALDEFTKAYVASLLRQTEGNVTRAAKASGLERQSFQQLMRRAGIRSEDYR